MSHEVGQMVLFCKANPSLDAGLQLGQNVRMAAQRKKSLSRYDLEFLARTWAAREAAGMTQVQLGEKLGRLTQDHYKQYEIRSPLPHHLVPAFLEATKVSYDYLFTGRAEGPAWRARYQELVDRQNKKKIAKKAA